MYKGENSLKNISSDIEFTKKTEEEIKDILVNKRFIDLVEKIIDMKDNRVENSYKNNLLSKL